MRIKNNLDFDSVSKKVRAGIGLYAQTEANRMEDDAKRSATWTDRTGNARNSIQEVEVRNFDDYSPAIRAQTEVGALGFYADMNSENWGAEPWINGPLHEEMYDKDQKFIRDQLEWQNEEKSNDTDKMRDNAWNFVSDLPIPGREPERTFYAHTDEYMETLGEMMRISTR